MTKKIESNNEEKETFVSNETPETLNHLVWDKWSLFIIKELEHLENLEKEDRNQISELRNRFDEHLVDYNKDKQDIYGKISSIQLNMAKKLAIGGAGGAITTGILELIKYLTSNHVINLPKQ